ncbi:nucleosome assembly protein 1-like 4 isoform X3 [Lineus longissimus]|uniref:nucleosome assembly protein 1-like 4 isoform X3 n=1 Tax=Lineus longissimus TaxID=88925 RepID=UPI002B4F045B
MADPEKAMLVENENAEEAGEGDAAPTVPEMETIETQGASRMANFSGGLSSEVAQLMQSPEMLAAVQDRLAGMVGLSSGYIESPWLFQAYSLPKVVKRRIKALKKLQFEVTKIEADFYEEVHQLECKYASKYSTHHDKRREVLTGAIEPTDSDCDWPSDTEDEDETKLADEMKKTKIAEDGEKPAEDGKDGEKKEEKKEENAEEKKEEENPTGIPFFWLTVFKNVEMLADMIQEHDEPIIKNLQDILVKYHDKDPYGFTLEFHFAPNDFFTNNILTKEYTLRMQPDETDPFSFEGPEIIKCKGCTIDWKKGKNVTVKTVKKTQKHKGSGSKRVVTKQIQNDSFFNFFTPPKETEGEEEADEDNEAILAADFEIGHFIRERIVPRAVLYFTGEALDDDDEYEEEGEEEEDGDEDGQYDEDADADFVPSPPGGHCNHHRDRHARRHQHNYGYPDHHCCCPDFH